jgi:thioredoxin reductase
MAELSTPDAPFPPGDYPLLVIGSGPGALQVSSSLRALGVEHAVISADPSPGGMFRRWPHFQRLLSWTKPFAPVPRGSRAYERYDWNSLLSDDPACRALQPGLMDGTSYFPSRPEMEANLVAFADCAGITVRYGCRWTATRRVETPDGDRFEVETTDGIYRCRVLVVAVVSVGAGPPKGRRPVRRRNPHLPAA